MKKIILSVFILHFAFCIFQAGIGQIIHVPADQPNIQAGINAANDGDTVLVAEGIYYENISFMGKAILVASDFITDGNPVHIDNTIINGSQSANPDAGSVVTFNTGEDTASVLCGFTITGGTGTVLPAWSARVGGGITCQDASAKIIHNRITGNGIIYSGNAWGGGIITITGNWNLWTVVCNNDISGNQCASGTGSAQGGGISVMGNARICGNSITGNLCSATSGINDGGGIYHISVTTPPDTLILTGNLVHGNNLSATATARGAGVITLFSHCLIGQNQITANSMSGNMTNGCGVLVREAVSATVTGNIISHNSVITNNIYWGVGCEFVMPAGPTYFLDNEVSYNTGPYEVNNGYGGGLAVMDAELNLLSVEGNRFRENAGELGGGFYSRSCYNQFLVNNLYVGNESVEGGAIGINNPASAENGRPVLANNTIAGNSASSQGGAVSLDCATNIPVFFNCIFRDNTAPVASDISYTGSADPVVISYSDINTGNISGPWTGAWNFNADPGFIPGDTLYHLGLTSPCKNAGTGSLDVNGTVYDAPVADMDGEGRPDPQYHYFDAGCDERWEIPPAPLALSPDIVGPDYFVARWRTVALATGYRLDVAFDAGFSQMVTGYDNLDAGNDTAVMVTGLESEAYYYRVRATNALFTSQHSNVITVLGVSIEAHAVQSSKVKVQSYPNPFSVRTTVEFCLPEDGEVSLKLYDLTGREVQSLVTGHWEKGNHNYVLQVGGLQRGIYILRLTANGQRPTANGQRQTANCRLVVR